MAPAITALIDAYNHERFIEEAIVSVLEQDVGHRDLEVLVVDDGSTDGTENVVASFGPRVKYLRKANGGQASSFNVGLAAAQGEFVAFLDADDYWFPGKLATVLDVMEGDSGAGAVGHAIAMVDGEGIFHRLAPRESFHLHLKNTAAARLFGGVKALLGTSRFVARRDLLERMLPVPEVLRIEADEWLFTLAAAHSGVAILEQELTAYRIHDGNLFQTPSLERLADKYRVLAALARLLPKALGAAGVQEEVVAAVVEPIWLESERLRLVIWGGKPWDAYKVERCLYRIAGPSTSRIGSFVRGASLVLSAVIPPPRYYRLRSGLHAGAKGIDGSRLTRINCRGEVTWLPLTPRAD